MWAGEFDALGAVGTAVVCDAGFAGLYRGVVTSSAGEGMMQLDGMRCLDVQVGQKPA